MCGCERTGVVSAPGGFSIAGSQHPHPALFLRDCEGWLVLDHAEALSWAPYFAGRDFLDEGEGRSQATVGELKRTDSVLEDLIGWNLAAGQFVGQALILGGEIEKIPLPFCGGFFPRGFSHQFRQVPIVLCACKFVFHRRPARRLFHIDWRIKAS
jgi:hypothetical protein